MKNSIFSYKESIIYKSFLLFRFNQYLNFLNNGIIVESFCPLRIKRILEGASMRTILFFILLSQLSFSQIIIREELKLISKRGR